MKQQYAKDNSPGFPPERIGLSTGSTPYSCYRGKKDFKQIEEVPSSNKL